MESTYEGKPLSEYSKDELIKIIEEMASTAVYIHKQHAGDLNVICGLPRDNL